MRVRWARGGEGEILSIGADTIVLRSTVPAPPGERLSGTIDADADADADGSAPALALALVLRVKVHGCRRGTKGEFLIEGRPLDLARDVREYLQAMVRTTARP